MNNLEIVRSGLKKRYAKERRFKVYGIFAITLSLLFLLLLLFDIGVKSIPAFTQTYINLDIEFSEDVLKLDQKKLYSDKEIFESSYSKLGQNALYKLFPSVVDRKEKKALRQMLSSGAKYDLRDAILENKDYIGTTQNIWVIAGDDIDSLVKGLIDRKLPESSRRVKDYQIKWLDELKSQNKIERRFNINFFTNGDSREPEQAGILGALKGSFYTMLVTLLLSFPIAVSAAIYLEEFAPKKNWWVDLIEININNLAAVPSIVFGILGLAVYINLFGVPRSAPLVGGLVLSLMTLPTIIISTRAALKSVPPSIREAALSIGASKLQVIVHHVLPLAMPGILTGSIIGMAQALGETAPLLMIGMIAFVADIPQGMLDPSTVLPVQVFIWSDSPERGFIALTSAAIVTLLVFLFFMNLIAILLRKKFETRW
ncbi:MAG: phosphate ABC transporter permease PstA [Candidatus Thioglobus sp.]|nr:phosphate ABC transporter permease PstA [Candidatus Thioglobus sp.]